MLDALEQQGIDPEIRTYNTGEWLSCASQPASGAGERFCGLNAWPPGGQAGTGASSTLCWPLKFSLPRRPAPPAVIIACNMSGQAQEALRIYERMLAAGAQPTATTYTALISAYGKNGQLDKALQIFQVGAWLAGLGGE